MYKRYLQGPITEALADTPVILLNGARQTGKSTLCGQLLSEGVFAGEIVTLDDPTALEAARRDPLAFLEGLDSSLIIDEVQRAPELLLSIKKLVDRDRKHRRLILTGSADVLTLPKVADSLAGRMEILALWPLAQNEILGTPSTFIDRLLSPEAEFSHSDHTWEDLVRLMTTGGYPEAVLRSTSSRRSRWFDSYLTSILQKDIRDLANIEGLTQLPTILQLIATRIGSTVNFSDIARLSQVKHTTLLRYVALIEHIFIIVKIPAWTPNAEGQFVKSPKVYLNDAGLLCYLRGDDIESLSKDRIGAGSVLENFVVMEILKQLSWSGHALKPCHFSIHKSHEVDLVLINRKSQIYGIEIKAAASLKSSDFNGLRHLAALSKSKFQKGVVLYTGEMTIPFGDNLYAVPVSAVWG